MTKKVFIVNNSGHVFTAAEPFGELIFLTEGLFDRYDLTGMFRTFEPILGESREDDFILHSGPGVMSAVACSIFAAKHRCLNLLIWRGEKGGTERYVQRKLTFNN
tara:strand:+ start:864 stop:1178 length:315 start_codon:yes stop_codon:yes gene_type:complete